MTFKEKMAWDGSVLCLEVDKKAMIFNVMLFNTNSCWFVLMSKTGLQKMKMLKTEAKLQIDRVCIPTTTHFCNVRNVIKSL